MITEKEQDKTIWKSTSGEEFTKDRLIRRQSCKIIKKLPERFIKMKFDVLEGEIYGEIIEKLNSWDYLDPPVCSFLSNQNGIGKTHLGICIFKKYIKDFYLSNFENNIKYYLDNGYYSKKDPKCIFQAERKLLLDIRETYKNKYESENDILKIYFGCDILFLDDLFVSGDNDFNRRIIYSILDERCEWLNRPTILTSNYSIQEIQNIDSRIASRIDNSMCFQIDSKQIDYRRRR